MRTSQAVALAGSLLIAPGCTRTIVVQPGGPQPAPAAAPVPSRPAPQPEPPRTRPQPQPATAATLGIPAGHLPDPGECRIWIPGTSPGRQRSERSASCHGIAQTAPGGSWIVYRPSRDRKLVHIRVTDRQRPGTILVVHVFEAESGRFLRDEAYVDDQPRQPTPTTTTTTATPRTEPQRPQNADPRRTPENRPAPTSNPTPGDRPAPTFDPGTGRPIPVPPPINPTTAPAPTLEPGPGDRRKPTTSTPTTTPGTPAPGTPAPGTPAPGTPAPAPNTAPLDIPPGHMPPTGECRIWIPGTPPGRQPHRNSGDCDQITREAPAGSWVVYRPTMEKKLVHVRVIDAFRAGVVVTVRVYDETGKFVREQRS